MKLRAFPSSHFVQRLASTRCILAGLCDLQARGWSKNKLWPMAFTFPSLYFSKWNKYTLIPSSKFSGLCCREVYESISDAKTQDWANTRNAINKRRRCIDFSVLFEVKLLYFYIHCLNVCFHRQNKANLSGPYRISAKGENMRPSKFSLQPFFSGK